MYNPDPYVPRACLIKSIRDEAPETRTYTLALKTKKAEGDLPPVDEHDFGPGQFVVVGLLGHGEAPFSLCSSPTQEGTFEICVRRTGSVTQALAALKSGDEVGVRGPYGNGFPVDELVGQGLVFVADGIHLAPLRSVINYVMDRRDQFGRVTVLYGAGRPDERVFKDDLSRWATQPNTVVVETIGREDPAWTGRVGGVTERLDDVADVIPLSSILVAGPPEMIRSALAGLLARQAQPEKLFASLERQMKCGIGTCGHCYLEGKYVCLDGPVFRYPDLATLAIDEVAAVRSDAAD